MKYILIVWVIGVVDTWGQGGGMASAEFDSLRACEAAGGAVIEARHDAMFARYGERYIDYQRWDAQFVCAEKGGE